MSVRLIIALASLSPAASAFEPIRSENAQSDEPAASTTTDVPLPKINEKAHALAGLDGLLRIFPDNQRGRIWLEVPPVKGPRGEIGEYIYQDGLRTGLGSNPVGLDRGQLGDTRLVVLRRVGGRILIEQKNLAFRALSDAETERIAVRESFAPTILWAGRIEAEEDDGRTLVDLSSFLVRDAHAVIAKLKSTGQGEFTLDEKRSLVDTSACLAFPDNLEFEALLTFSSTAPGAEVRKTAPARDSFTLVQHHSLIRLPDDGYRPRLFDPRAASFAVEFQDYATPLESPIETRWIVRHRLEKDDPTAERSRPKKPIVYYVDSGAPEPVRQALIDGAGWWNRAFESAGFIDAFRVEVMPEGAHPLDVRYNVIQWVHRATRGWSYGTGVIDPRTGEIIKGHVSLGSLRVRQDRLLFEGLAGTRHTASGQRDDPVELALARLRQLSAHEVGHTLGFAHNFAASTYGGRASVMDYPAPLIKVTDNGALDFSDAYGVGVGSWDVHAVRYAYSQFLPEADETEKLDAIIQEGLQAGLMFVTDEDARPLGAAHPLASLWDNGSDPAQQLAETLMVRQIALDRFGQGNIAYGEPLARLEEVLATVYFHHRFQLEAAGKLIGGLNYGYALRGDGQPMTSPVTPVRQRQALNVILDCLTPSALDLPERVLSLLAPRPFGYVPNREMFAGRTSPVFDPLSAAGSAAEMVTAVLLEPARCARLVDFGRRHPEALTLSAMVDAIISRAFVDDPPESARHLEIRRTVQAVVVSRLIALAGDSRATPGVRARVRAALSGLLGSLSGNRPPDRIDKAHAAMLIADIDRFLRQPFEPTAPPAGADPPPPGSPIGSGPPDFGQCHAMP
jgi:hypothetical protein